MVRFAASFVVATLAVMGIAVAQQPELDGVELRIQPVGYSNVEVTVIANAAGGRARIPRGTVVTTGDQMQQDLVLGEGVVAELEPGTTQTFTVPAFCIHSDRGSPHSAMQVSAAAEQEVRALVSTLDRGVPQHLVQSAVWSYRNGQMPSDEQVLKVYEMAHVAAKAADAPVAGADLPVE